MASQRNRDRMCAHRHALIVGCQRCGTTQLTTLLGAHPQVQLAEPLRPEPKYFLDPRSANCSSDEYCNRLFGDTQIDVCLEKSTSYFECPEYAERIRTVLGSPHIIVMLRHPVARAISHYRFSVENKLEIRPLAEALFGDSVLPRPHGVSVSPFRYIGRSLYVRPLRWYAERFRHLRVLVMETTLGDAAALQEVYEWLGVNKSFRPPMERAPANKSTIEVAVEGWVLRKLEDLLMPQIECLEAEFGLDLAAWRSGWPWG